MPASGLYYIISVMLSSTYRLAGINQKKKNTQMDQKFSLVPNWIERIKSSGCTLTSRYLFVSIDKQRLFFVQNGMIKHIYAVSTSQFGVGNKEGSFKTPTGIHKIASKIGKGAPMYRIFRSRVDTGITWTPDINEENLVLTRILRLEGCEKGINRDKDIDSFSRYIYLHGTNREELIGTPISHGCICMKNKDIIELFDMVEEKDIVIIDRD